MNSAWHDCTPSLDSHSYSPRRKRMFSWPGYISSAEAQEGLNTPNSLWPGWSWLTLLRGIQVFLRGLVFPLSKPSRYFKGVLIIWCSKAIKSETKHQPNVIFASFFFYFQNIVNNADHIKCRHSNHQVSCLTKQKADVLHFMLSLVWRECSTWYFSLMLLWNVDE